MHPNDSIPILTDHEPAELLVHDDLAPCPYMDGRQARLPLRMPIRSLEPAEFDLRLADGDRRHGRMLYRPTCPDCSHCEAIRLEVNDFRLHKTHRRVLRQGDLHLRLEVSTPRASRARVALYDKHLTVRKLRSGTDDTMTLGRYRQFLADSCCDTVEITYWDGDTLVGVAIADRGEQSLSAHYCFYDPDRKGWSLGTYSILKQLELCRQWNLRYLYLGLYVAGNPHMRYKGSFLPHERLIDGAWRLFR